MEKTPLSNVQKHLARLAIDGIIYAPGNRRYYLKRTDTETYAVEDATGAVVGSFAADNDAHTILRADAIVANLCNVNATTGARRVKTCLVSAYRTQQPEWQTEVATISDMQTGEVLYSVRRHNETSHIHILTDGISDGREFYAVTEARNIYAVREAMLTNAQTRHPDASLIWQ